MILADRFPDTVGPAEMPGGGAAFAAAADSRDIIA